MNTLQSVRESFGTRIMAVETSQQDCEISTLEAKCETLEKCNKLLMAKTKDLESRSRRQNLRVVSIPEDMERSRVTAFMTDFFVETLSMDIPEELEILDWAHHLALRPGAGSNAPPRPMIVKVLHF